MFGALFSTILSNTIGSIITSLIFITASVSPTVLLGTASKEPLTNTEFKSGSILFVGDVMLGRRVERMMDELGAEYPFLGTQDLIQNATVAVGNFEGTVPSVHASTPDFGFQFSMKNSSLQTLKNVGFDVLSLANNHSFDHGVKGYQNTLLECKKSGLVCSGHPKTSFTHSTSVVTVGDTSVGILFLYALVDEPSKNEIAALLDELNAVSDVQIAYVHWGTEYNLSHSIDQSFLARALIDVGVDAVMGHHPHVVEEVERYREKPIFYSLGNFVFDQYFNDDVQAGLAVRMSIEKDNIVYTAIPLTSKLSRSQPQIATIEESVVLLSRILNPLRNDSVVNLSMGSLIIPRTEDLQVLVTKL